MARMGNQSWLIRALVTILLLIIVKTSTTSAATSNDCLNQCSLTATTDSINKFLALKKQNKFRIITLTLAINNDTNGLSLAANLASSYEADKWVWALETYGRSYLALPFDINIFSMGTLTLFQRTATINITATPNNCLASLNETCKRKVIGKFLSGITQTDYNLHMMCHRVAQSEAFLWLLQNQLAYECCNELDSLSGSWDCNHPVELNGWLNILYVMIYASIVLVVLYVPEKILNEVSEEYERWFYRSKRKKPRSSSRQNKKQQQANNNNDYGINHQDEPDASKQHKISIQDDKELATFNKRNLRQLFDFDKYSYTELIILDGDVPFQVLPKRWNWKTNRCYQILFILLSPIVIVIFLALQLTINRQLFERVYLTNLTQQQLYEYLIPAVCGGFGLFVIVGAWIVATLTTDSLTNNVFIDWLDDLQVVEEDDSDDDDEERKEEKSNLPAIFSTHGSHEIVKFHRTVAKNRSLLFSSTYWSNYRIWVWDTPIQYWTAAKKQMLQSVNMYEQLFSCIGFMLATGLLPVVVLILCLPVFVVFLLMPIPLVYCFLTSIAGVHKILSRKITGLCNILLIIIFFICSLYFYIILIGLLAVSAYLILYTFAFTVVGIIVNADVSTPYLIFIVIIIYYLFSVISDRYVRKQKLKKLAFEICEKLESNRESQFSLDKQREILGKAVVDDQQQNKPETRRKHRKYTLPPLKMKNSRIDPIDIPKQPLYDDEETSLDQTFTPLQKIKTLFFEDHHGAAYVPLAVYKEVCAQHLGSSRRTFIRFIRMLCIVIFTFAAIMSFGQLQRLTSLAKPLAAFLIGYLPLLVALGDSNAEAALNDKKLKKEVISTIYRFATDIKKSQLIAPEELEQVSQYHNAREALAHGIIMDVF